MTDDRTTTLTGSGGAGSDGEWLVVYDATGRPRGAVRAGEAEVVECTTPDSSSWHDGFVLYYDAGAETKGYVGGGWRAPSKSMAHDSPPRERGWHFVASDDYDTVSDLPATL